MSSSAFESFVAVHQYQLQCIPQELWQPLFMKLGEDYLDAGTAFELHYGDPLPGYSLHLKSDVAPLQKHSDIYLLDHAWTTTPETARQQLHENPTTLLARMENMMNIEKEEGWVDDDDEEEDKVDHDDEVIEMVAKQANVSHEVAKQALEDENYEVVNAIAKLTMDPEFQKKSDELQEQVLGQLIASGKAQEKEDTVNKEKEERKKQWIKDWMNRRVEKVYNAMWSYVQTYSYTVLKTDGQSDSHIALYMNDEVGSAIAHSFSPNMMCVPFIFSRGASATIPYSVLFPVNTIQPGQLVTCDLLPKGIVRNVDKKAYLFAFEDRVAPGEEATEHEREALIQVYLDRVAAINSHRSIKEIDSRIISQNVSQADTTAAAVTEASQQPPFENEACLTQQEHLTQLIREAYGFTVPWLPLTFFLSKELAECVGSHLHQLSLPSTSEEADTVYWLIQPYEESVGVHSSKLPRRVISTLPELIRQYDAPMTRHLAQHYPIDLYLYNGKKFHLRYTAFLRSFSSSCSTTAASPCTVGSWLAGVYSNKFWVRLANKKYIREEIQDNERQLLTTDGFEMTSLNHTSFIRHMEKEIGAWDDIQAKINKIIQDILYAARSQSQPVGLLSKDATEDLLRTFTFDFTLSSQLQAVLVGVQASSPYIESDNELADALTLMAKQGSLEKHDGFTLL